MTFVACLVWLALVMTSTLSAVAWPTITIVDEARYTQEAQATWENVVDKSNPRYPDHTSGNFQRRTQHALPSHCVTTAGAP